MKVDLYKKDKCRCPICHKKCPIYDHPKTIRRWRALDLGSIIGEIEMEPVRIECKKTWCFIRRSTKLRILI